MAQECIDYGSYLHLLNAISGGGIDVDVNGGFAYAASTNSLRVLDIRDPLNPIWRGSAATTNWPRGVAYSDGIAYVVEQPYASRLHAIDVRDPDNPIVLSTVPTYGWCQAVAVSGHLAFALCQGLKVFDVSNPAAPVRLDDVYNLYDANALAVDGNLVAVASSQFDQYGHLHLIDVSNPSDTKLIRMMYLPGPGYAVALSGRYAYVGGRVYPPSSGRLYIIDISTPQTPVLVNQLQLSALPKAVTVRDGFLYVIDDAKRLTTYKLADPVHPETIGQITLRGTGKKIVFAGDVGVAAAGGVSLFGGNPSSAPILGQTVGAAPSRQVAYSGDFAFLACGASGILIVDISDPRHPEVKGTIRRGRFDAVAAAGSLVVAADNDSIAGTGKLVVIDASDPAYPAASGSADAGGLIKGIALTGNRVFVVSDDEQLRIFAVEPGLDPTLLAALDLGHACAGVCVSDGRAYIASDALGVHIVDVTDPTHPVARGIVGLSGYSAQAVAASAGRVYAVGGGTLAGMFVVDVADADAPVVIGSAPLPGAGRGAVISEHVLYVAAQGAGLVLFDIGGEDAPVQLGARPVLGSANDVQVGNGYVLVADGELGLTLLPTQCQNALSAVPTDDRRDDGDFTAIWPNPFNPRTTIEFSVTIPGRVTVVVYDVRGREVARLRDDVLDPGQYACEWNGGDDAGRSLPSGTYLCRLTTAKSSRSARLTLLR